MACLEKPNHHAVSSIINVSITDIILTPGACAFLINEVFMNFLYQRSQIPYPYAWLKSIVVKKRNSEEKKEESRTNFTINKHYQTVSSTYDAAESIMAEIVKALTYYGKKLKEVLFVIGVTPVCLKEVVSIRISNLAVGHVERNHVNDNSKKQGRILRKIFLENTWMNLIEKLPCSNTFVYLKLKGSEDMTLCNEGIFIRCKPLAILSSVKQTTISLNYLENQSYLCCDKLEVFQDLSDVDNSVLQLETEDDSVERTDVWLQSKISIKGYKDCFINKVPASDLW